MGIWGRVVNLIFPGACRQCGTPVFAGAPTSCFCNRCWDTIRWFEDPCCPQCGLPYPSLDPLSVHQQSPAGHLCGACRKNPPYFDRAISAGPYEGVLAGAIKLFKYKKKIHVGRALAEHSPLLQRGDRGDFVMPVPLHPSRLREREFNQSAILASVIGERLGIQVLLNTLIRHVHTRPQVELGMKERKKNVVGAFSVQDDAMILGKDIVLVDDVYTTGATVGECARVLKRHGVGRVSVLTIARMVG